MLINRSYALVGIMATLILVGSSSCGKDSPIPAPAPGTVALTTPADKTACLRSSVITGNKAAVTLTWKVATDADSYRVTIRNLNTQTTESYTLKNASYTASLNVNTPYSWSVVAINSVGETSSEEWSFYFAGTSSSSYAPFPANQVAPASGAIVNANGASSVPVNFQWIGSDPDSDVASYSLFLDETNASTRVVASQTTTTSTQNLTSGKTYYWKVVTTDNAGNTSTSMVHSFQVR